MSGEIPLVLRIIVQLYVEIEIVVIFKINRVASCCERVIKEVEVIPIEACLQVEVA